VVQYQGSSQKRRAAVADETSDEDEQYESPAEDAGERATQKGGGGSNALSEAVGDSSSSSKYCFRCKGADAIRSSGHQTEIGAIDSDGSLLRVPSKPHQTAGHHQER